jgi:hypothetical protein
VTSARLSCDHSRLKRRGSDVTISAQHRQRAAIFQRRRVATHGRRHPSEMTELSPRTFHSCSRDQAEFADSAAPVEADMAEAWASNHARIAALPIDGMKPLRCSREPLLVTDEYAAPGPSVLSPRSAICQPRAMSQPPRPFDRRRNNGTATRIE